jgi:Holliday junction resolvasome RuvABC endonuclease subunit
MSHLFLDVSSCNVGVAFFVQGKLRKSGQFPMKTKNQRLCERLVNIRLLIQRVMRETSPMFVAIEAPMGGSRGKQGGRKSTIAVIGAFGVALEACFSAGRTPVTIYPKKWQSVLGLATTKVRTKDLTGPYVEGIIGKRVGEDEADAIAMGLAWHQNKTITEAV